MKRTEPHVVYEDNHLLIVCKAPGEIVQGDKTGDEPMVDSLKRWIKQKHDKPGNVFLGLVNRLDRPVGGLVIFAKTSKALTRMNKLLQEGAIRKIYLAIVTDCPPRHADRLIHHLVRRESQNKSYAYDTARSMSKRAELSYRHLASAERYHLLEVELYTGRHHQIRCQLSSIGLPIKGDLKYGAPRSNSDGSIGLLSYQLSFVHPVGGQELRLYAPIPDDKLWRDLVRQIKH
ncbi:MAG: RluA family pseudouridine synthase [Porphyromonadaceae bacterium]|nr:RluA family pseudouridine synthase [Porphyromonadaceae bacterium]